LSALVFAAQSPYPGCQNVVNLKGRKQRKCALNYFEKMNKEFLRQATGY
jgi:hypothetical protein